MSGVLQLERLLRRRPIVELLNALVDGDSYRVESGTTLRIGEGALDDPLHRVEVEGRSIATVAGHHAARVAEALTAVASIEHERRMLADEVLALYREVNLLYALSDRLAVAIDSGDLANRIHAEATRLVDAEAAIVVIDAAVERQTEFGAPDPAMRNAELGRARTVTDVVGAMLVAPITVDDTDRGAIVLRRATRPFTAGDLKLVSTVASQAAPLVDRVLDGERRQAAAERRERRLQDQIEQLQVELDASRLSTDHLDHPVNHIAELRARIDVLRNIVRSVPDTVA
jgi:GAF domain-containing protein